MGSALLTIRLRRAVVVILPKNIQNANFSACPGLVSSFDSCAAEKKEGKESLVKSFEATEGKRSMVKSFGAIFSLDGTQLAEDILELTATRSSDNRVAAHKLRVAELAKELDLRQKEVDALAGDIQAQMKIAEEGGEAADGAGAELARLLALKGQFSKRIAELKNQKEVYVSVTAHEVTTVVKLPAGSFRHFPWASKPLCWCPQVVAEHSTREITKTIKMPMETAELTPLRTLVLSLNGEQKFYTYDFPRGYTFSLTSPLSVKAVVCRFDGPQTEQLLSCGKIQKLRRVLHSLFPKLTGPVGLSLRFPRHSSFLMGTQLFSNCSTLVHWVSATLTEIIMLVASGLLRCMSPAKCSMEKPPLIHILLRWNLNLSPELES
eukprot:g40739.t1